jgi:hypothetical protein
MAGGGLSEVWKYDRKKRLKLQMMDSDITDFINSLTSVTNRQSLYMLTIRHITARLIAISAKILEEAARRCPYSTGELRNSGRVLVSLGGASGTGSVAAKVTGGESAEPSVEIVKPYFQKNTKVISSEIKFSKKVKGKDLALWAHEELLHYVKRPKSGAQKGQWYSRHFRTGPKYLESAFKLYKKEIPIEIEKGLMEAVRVYNKRWKKRVRRKI